MGLKQRLDNGHVLLGTLLSLPSPEIAEINSHLGFDWLFLDLEHGPHGFIEAQRIIQAVGNRTPVLTRVPELTESAIKKALDIGSEGVIVPKVNTADEARAVVRFAKYQPLGDRGVGAARAHKYGVSFNEYMAEANLETLVVVQIEHIDGVKNIDEIVKVEGIDVVFIGPYDLSGSLGVVGQVNHTLVTEAIEKVEETVRSQNLALGYFGTSPDAVLPMVEKNYQLITCGTDSDAIISYGQNILERLKP